MAMKLDRVDRVDCSNFAPRLPYAEATALWAGGVAPG